jgi:hypothetical protein
MDEDCVILDLPEGLRLNLLGLIIEIDRIRITADRAGLLGALLAALTCGGVESADRLESLAQMVRSQAQDGGQEQQGEEAPEQESEGSESSPRRRRARSES